MAATEGPLREEGLQGPLLPRAQARPRGPPTAVGTSAPCGLRPSASFGLRPRSACWLWPPPEHVQPPAFGHRRNACSLRPPATAVPGDLTLRRAEAGPRLQSQAPIEAASHSSSNTATVISDFSFVSFVSLLRKKSTLPP